LREDEALIRGLELFGIGKWKKINYYELSGFTEQEVELRTCLLLGVFDISQYESEKMTRKRINEIRLNHGLPAINV